MKNENEKQSFANSKNEPGNGKDPISTEKSEKDLNDDPLEVVRKEEEDEKKEEDTQDDMFNDDELDLDPSLDQDEW